MKKKLIYWIAILYRKLFVKPILFNRTYAVFLIDSEIPDVNGKRKINPELLDNKKIIRYEIRNSGEKDRSNSRK